MALVERRRGLYGLTHADQFLEGPASGSWVLFIDSEAGLGTAIIHLEQDDSTEVYPSGSAQYNYWHTNVNETGDFVLGPDLTNGQQRRMNMIIWFEGFLIPAVLDANSAMQGAGMTNAQRIVGIAATLVSQGVPPANANAIASAYVGSATVPKYTDLGMTDFPERLKRLAALLAYRSEA